MDIKELNCELQRAVPDLKPGYLVTRVIGKGGVGEGVYRCRNPRIVLKLQSKLDDFAALHKSGVLNNPMFPRVYKLVTQHDNWDNLPYGLLWREACYMPPEGKKPRNLRSFHRGFDYTAFSNDDDRVVNEARRLTAAAVEYQNDWGVPNLRYYNLPAPWRITPPAELVHFRQALQQLKDNNALWSQVSVSSLDIHFHNFGFVTRGRGAKRTRRIVWFDPVVF